MAFLVLLIFGIIFIFTISMVYLLIGLFFLKFKKTNRLGIWFLARSMMVPGKCLACRCHQDCRSVKCRNWNCANFYHCRDSKK